MPRPIRLELRRDRKLQVCLTEEEFHALRDLTTALGSDSMGSTIRVALKRLADDAATPEFQRASGE